jgi:hypothetical protein
VLAKDQSGALDFLDCCADVMRSDAELDQLAARRL